MIRPLLPDDILERCNNRLVVCTTRVWPKPRLSPVLVSRYQSKDQLIDAVAASCFIPLYSSWNDKRIYTRISGDEFSSQIHIDGGIFAFMPPVGDIGISPFPAKFVIKPMGRKPEISLGDNDYPLHQLLIWALRPPNESIIRDLFKRGQEQAEKWVASEATKC
jgi:hypothetical protein